MREHDDEKLVEIHHIEKSRMETPWRRSSAEDDVDVRL